METLTSKIICPQCGGENEIPVDEKFTECVFCGSAIFIDKRKVVSHFVIASNFKKEEAEGNLRRWMAGNFQVKDLDKLAQISQVTFYYFPMWYFKTGISGGDKIYLQPATSTSISEIKKINIPAGSLKVFNKKDFDVNEFINPDVLLDSAQNWLKDTGVTLDTIESSNLVHIPFYHFYYSYKGNQYSALIEASSGKVYANLWPAKSEAPFRIVFALSIIAFFIISILAFILGTTDKDFLLTVEFIKILGYGLAAVPLILIAYFIAKKV
jgi:DNA-directed RNA polymerase subunit RPC12/RpoP